MRAALRYGDVSADRMGVFAADLRRLRQVKCGNQFALPAGLLSRILMNLSLSLHTHTNNLLSHIHSNTHFNSFLGRREWENSWADHCCPQGCVGTDYMVVPLDTFKTATGKRGESQTWSTTPAAQPHLNTKHTHVDTFTARNIQNRNQTRTCSCHTQVQMRQR